MTPSRARAQTNCRRYPSDQISMNQVNRLPHPSLNSGSSQKGYHSMADSCCRDLIPSLPIKTLLFFPQNTLERLSKDRWKPASHERRCALIPPPSLLQLTWPIIELCYVTESHSSKYSIKFAQCSLVLPKSQLLTGDVLWRGAGLCASRTRAPEIFGFCFRAGL